MPIKKILIAIVILLVMVLLYISLSTSEPTLTDSPSPTQAPISSRFGNNSPSLKVIINPQDILIPQRLPLLSMQPNSPLVHAQAISGGLNIPKTAESSELWQTADGIQSIFHTSQNDTITYSYFDPSPKTTIATPDKTSILVNQFLSQANLQNTYKISNKIEYLTDDAEFTTTTADKATIIKHILTPNYQYPILTNDQPFDVNYALVDASKVIQVILSSSFKNIAITQERILKTIEDIEKDITTGNAILTNIENLNARQPIDSADVKSLRVRSQQIHYRYTQGDTYAFPYIALIGTSTINNVEYQIELALSLVK